MTRARLVLALVASTAVASCTSAHTVAPVVVGSEPQLGGTFTVPDSTHFEMVAASQLAPTGQVRYAGVVFTVAVDAAGHIIYVATSDPSFHTPEGLATGSPLSALLANGVRQPIPEPGWGFHTALPSGWHAAFTNGRGLSESPLPLNSPVRWFFKRS